MIDSTTRGTRRARWILAVTLLVLWAPLVPLVIRAQAEDWVYPDVVPNRFSARGWHAVLDPRGEILHGVLLSLSIGLAVALIACLLAWPAGRALGLYRFRGRRAIQLLLLAPVIVPTMASAMGLHILFIRFGLADRPLGVVLVLLVPTIPYATSILAAGFANLDAGYEQQARVLGARKLARTLKVTIPLMRAPLAAAALMAFLISWSDYILTLLIGGGQVQTLPIQLFAAIGSTDSTLAAAVAIAVVVPALVVVGLASRLLTKASAAGIGMAWL